MSQRDDEGRIEPDEDSSLARVGEPDGERVRIGRRKLLAVAGSTFAVSAVASQGALADDEQGYGVAGYGDGPYGDPEAEDDGEEDETDPDETDTDDSDTDESDTDETDSDDSDTDDPEDDSDTDDEEEIVLVVETGPVGDVTSSSATLSGDLSETNAETTDVFFDLREADATEWSRTEAGSLSEPGLFDRTVTELAADSEYRYRAVATADDETVTGETRSFATAEPAPPSVDRLSVEEDSPPNPHAELDVEWAVSDPDGELDAVTIEVTGDGSRSTSQSAEVSVDGETANGLETFEFNHGAGSTYEIELTVTDGTNTTSATDEIRTT